ncbi:LEA type 2 family protein [Pseudobacteriovorax antillogorgiicola]|uniref:LEA14-like dessication related protein n=1 Tax=Pseudobacteriovorax antillogorgiicola TaxID=1513793 RepID=A0A1Y6C842_9BACT|nr:LEA type 2 family protein [Pseudobacteriovorax antillogorgiicola]TCS51804.1 LEA14-like dessication related protein [Pseudobacteriovorax antillogorgiicola]SMF50103.1 LEA14-like dessication related protein [Pseudobacteriovorax antillogorgiicola]
MAQNVLVVLFCVFLSSCSMLAKFVAEQPKVELSSISFSHLSLSRVELAFEVLVENPNSFELGLNRVDYEVFVSEQKIGKGHYQEAFRVAAKSKASLRIPFTLDTQAAISVAKEYFQRGGKLEARVKGQSEFSTPVGTFNSPFEASKAIVKP